MAERYDVYKCEGCGLMLEVVRGGGSLPPCCGQEMVPVPAKTENEGREKHLPVVAVGAGNVNVKVGSIPHPMADDHWIEFVEVITTKGVTRKYLNPGEEPEAGFETTDEVIEVREHCNKHGLWSTRP